MQTTSTKQNHAQESSFLQTQTEIYPVTEGNQSSHTKVAYKNSFNRFLRNILIKDLQVLLDQGLDVLNPMIIKYVIQKIIDINDNDLFIFLKEAAAPLLKIDKIENYLRAVDNTKIDAQQSYLEIKGHEVLANMSLATLIGANLSMAYLSQANLSEADLSKAFFWSKSFKFDYY